MPASCNTWIAKTENQNWALGLTLLKTMAWITLPLSSHTTSVSFNLSLDPLLCHPFSLIPFAIDASSSYQHLEVITCYHPFFGQHKLALINICEGTSGYRPKKVLAGCWVECVGPLSSCCDKLLGMCRLVTLLEVCFILGVLLGVWVLWW